MKKIWYYAQGDKYPENEPRYYESKDFPELTEIEKHWAEIKSELVAFIESKDKSFQSNTYQGVNVQGQWSSIPFVFWGNTMSDELYKKCPVLAKYLKQIKGLTSLSLSQLLPHSTIGRHRGDTNAAIRCHLGVEVPSALPACGINVGDKEKGWEEGKWTLFNDAYIHSAWNNSNKRRIVLIMDMVRPEFASKKNNICTHILTYQVIDNKLGRGKSFKDSSWIVKNVLFGFVFIMILGIRPLQNLIKSLF